MASPSDGFCSTRDRVLRFIEDLLLESPVPPSNWMPSRAERLADARDTLRRRFGEKHEQAQRPAHRLRDLGSAHPLYSGTRIVSGERIEADLEADVTTANPPILQGWAVILLVVVGGSMLAGLVALRRSGWEVALALFVGVPCAWVLLVVLSACGQRVIELGVDGVRIRRWTDVWLGRPGRGLGSPEELHATLPHPYHLVIAGKAGSVRLGLRTWPPSARADAIDELPIWGIECDFGHHRHHHSRRTRRSRALR
jgi:hypothetical protein